MQLTWGKWWQYEPLSEAVQPSSSLLRNMPIKRRRRSASTPVPVLNPWSGSGTTGVPIGNDGEEEEAEEAVVSGCTLDTIMQQGLELLSQRKVSPMESEAEQQGIDDIWKEVAKKVLREMDMEFIDIDGKEAQEPKVKAVHVSEDVEKPDNEEALLELTQALYDKLMFRKQEQVEMKIAVEQLYTRMIEAQLKLKEQAFQLKAKEEQLDALGHEIVKMKSACCNLQQELKDCERKLNLANQEASAAAKEASALQKEALAAKEDASAARKEAKVAEAEAIKLKRKVEKLKKKLVNKDGAIHLLNKSIMDPLGTFEKVYLEYTKLKNQLSSPPCVLNQSGTIAL